MGSRICLQIGCETKYLLIAFGAHCQLAECDFAHWAQCGEGVRQNKEIESRADFRPFALVGRLGLRSQQNFDEPPDLIFFETSNINLGTAIKVLSQLQTVERTEKIFQILFVNREPFAGNCVRGRPDGPTNRIVSKQEVLQLCISLGDVSGGVPMLHDEVLIDDLFACHNQTKEVTTHSQKHTTAKDVSDQSVLWRTAKRKRPRKHRKNLERLQKKL